MKFQKWTRTCAAMLALLLFSTAVPAQAESFRAIVTSGSMRVYADPGLGSRSPRFRRRRS